MQNTPDDDVISLHTLSLSSRNVGKVTSVPSGHVFMGGFDTDLLPLGLYFQTSLTSFKSDVAFHPL